MAAIRERKNMKIVLYNDFLEQQLAESNLQLLWYNCNHNKEVPLEAEVLEVGVYSEEGKDEAKKDEEVQRQ